jgi:hypothetical protein
MSITHPMLVRQPRKYFSSKSLYIKNSYIYLSNINKNIETPLNNY